MSNQFSQVKSLYGFFKKYKLEKNWQKLGDLTLNFKNKKLLPRLFFLKDLPKLFCINKLKCFVQMHKHSSCIDAQFTNLLKIISYYTSNKDAFARTWFTLKYGSQNRTKILEPDKKLLKRTVWLWNLDF